MVQIPTRTRTLSFSVREARTRPLEGRDERDAKRARQSYAMRAIPLAPKSVNVTVTACGEEWMRPSPSGSRARCPSPLGPFWSRAENPPRHRRGRVPPEPLGKKALKTLFARTPHGAAVVRLGARRAMAQAECVAAVERVRRQCPGLPRPQLSPPLVSRFPTDDDWVPLSVQPAPIEVHVEECDIVM